MNYIHEITLDINLAGEMPVVKVKQGDSSARFILATLEKDGAAFIPDEGVGIIFRCEKPDGFGVLEDSVTEDSELERYLVVDNRDGTVTIELTEQVSTCPGRCRCDLCFYKDEKILSSIPFGIHVFPSPNTTHLAVSSNDFRTLVTRTEMAENLMRGVAQSIATLTLSTEWNGIASPYTQAVPVSGYTVTNATKVDLVANPAVIEAMLDSRTDEIMIVNENGYLTAYAIGGKPTTALTVQAGLYETLPV